MKKSIFLAFLFLASCQTLYTYRLPNDSERKLFKDSLHWGYTGNLITSIPVVNDEGKIFRLPVTDKTKIEVKSMYGEISRFYIQSITIAGDEGIISTKTWSGYELLSHTRKTIMVNEIAEMKILSDEKAVIPIARP
jgi:hypothetical protein